MRAHLIALGRSPEQIKRVSRKYWKRKCKTAITEPLVLIQRFYDVYIFFKDMQDPERPGHSFFIESERAHALFIKEMKYIQVPCAAFS